MTMKHGLSQENVNLAYQVAKNVQPIFAHYGWVYGLHGGVPDVPDIYDNIIELMETVKQELQKNNLAFSYTMSGRILVLGHRGIKKLEVFLATPEELV